MDPQNFELMNRLGNVLRRMNSFGRASKLYTQALKISPHYNEAKYNLAACSVAVVTADSELVRQTRAVEAYVKPRRYDFVGTRTEFHPLGNQSLAEDKKGHKPVKKEEPEAKPSPEEIEQRNQLLVAELTRDLDGAPGTWEAEYNLGLINDLIGRGEQAIAHLRAALAIAPDNLKVVNNLAVALAEHKNDLTESENLLLESLQKNKFDRTTVLNLAVINKRGNKAFQTLKWYVCLGDLLAKSLGEFDLDKVIVHAKDLFERRKYIEAIPVFENLSREKPEEFWLDKLAVMYLNQKREDLYIGALRRVLKLNPDRDDAHKKITETAAAYEKEAHERLQKGSKPIAVNLLLKAVHVEETPERWAEIAQIYEELGEEIMADNAMKRWKELSAKAQSESPAHGAAQPGAAHPPAGQRAAPAGHAPQGGASPRPAKPGR
jgi:hypothetical protein